MNGAATIALAPLGLLYGTAMRARAALYRRGVLRTHQIDAPVISVGNLTTGGTGKTPLVEFIAKHLAQKGRRVCILTRGYGREDTSKRVVVSDGNNVLAEVAQSGDEPLMLAEKLKGRAAVICEVDRVSAAHWAKENLASDVFILDDGFQNLRTARDLNICVIDATNPWGSKRVLPAGILREPISSLRRADCVVITRANGSESDLLSRIKRFTGAPVFLSQIVTARIRSIKTGDEIELKRVARQPVAALCAIGNPEAFFNQLRADFDVADTTAFLDHHHYTQSDIDRASKDAIASGAHALVTTAKDEVKLRDMRFDLPCYVLDIEMQISPSNKLFDLIDKAVLKYDKS
ncbi:MAG TPA: tetraacyldisaccharide 4'-kinase [Pyrinomonadaceae bacterium]|nr:tetraacyldisaccharide 4'-kinase [Pyrinomonadaceae bacterium]